MSDQPREYHEEVAVHAVPGPEDPTPADVPRGDAEVGADEQSAADAPGDYPPSAESQ